MEATLRESVARREAREEDLWVCCDDAKVRGVEGGEVERRGMYMLFYEKN